MTADVDWQKEMAAEAARNARRVQATAEDIIERMRELQAALNIVGRCDDELAVEEAIETMERIVRGAQ